MMRQTMTTIGSLTIAMLASVPLGILTAMLAMAGEAVDCYVLSRLAMRYDGKRVPERARLLAMTTGAIQALTIAACVVICWRHVPSTSARFFAACFLMSAAINAGLVRRYFVRGATVRLTVYAITALAMGMLDFTQDNSLAGMNAWFFFATLMILGYTTTLFILAIERGQAERNRFELAVLENGLALRDAQLKEQASTRLAERLALAAKHANDSVLFTLPDGRIEWVNDAFSKITGYSFDEAVGRMPGDLLNAEDTDPATLEIIKQAHIDGVPVRVQLLNRTRDNRKLWMEVSISPVPRPDGKPEVFVAVERDITEAKAHAAALAAARVAAEAATNAKSQFLAAMSHEIRTPMNGVIGMAELLEETNLDPVQQHYTSTIIDSGRALLTIINDVLDLSKLQADKTEMIAEAFSVNTCVARAVDLLQPTAMKKKIALIAELAPDLPQSIGDPGRLRQILLNLLGNAVKFTASGGVKIKVRYKPQVDLDLIEIDVVDSGIGIAPDRLGKVFESFTQADSSISQQFGGTGLGLTISRLLAQRMGGDISVASEFGKGSTFTVSLRLPRAANTAQPYAAVLYAAPKTDLRLLIAEDNRTNMLITRKLIENSVGVITEASNGRQAVAAYRASQPDLILMDVSMPEVSGDEATREIRRFEAEAGLRRCPIVALTAYAAAEEEQMCLAAGMDAVLTKPLVRAELYALIENIAKETDRFDLSIGNDVDRSPKGGSQWSTSQRASGTTSGKSTRSSAH